MNFSLDNKRLDIPCPGCGHKISETVGKLKTNPTLVCPACKRPIAIKAEGLAAGLKQAEDAVADFKRTLSRLGK